MAWLMAFLGQSKNRYFYANSCLYHSRFPDNNKKKKLYRHSKKAASQRLTDTLLMKKLMRVYSF